MWAHLDEDVEQEEEGALALEAGDEADDAPGAHRPEHEARHQLDSRERRRP